MKELVNIEIKGLNELLTKHLNMGIEIGKNRYKNDIIDLLENRKDLNTRRKIIFELLNKKENGF